MNDLKTNTAVALCVTVLLVLCFLPVWSIDRPVYLFTPEEFESQKKQIETLAERLNAGYQLAYQELSMELQGSEFSLGSEELNRKYPYRLAVRHGSISGTRSLLLDVKAGERIYESLYICKGQLRLGIPHLIYDSENSMAYLTRGALEELLEFSKSG